MKVKDGDSEPKARRILRPLGSALLDSSLITGTINENFHNIKIIDCGNFIQIYYYESKRKRAIKDNQKIENNINKIIINNFENNNSSNKIRKNHFKEIDLKNINRSKLQLQRIAKCNLSVWQTFITLTFEENLTDLNLAYKKYKNFIYNLKRLFKDLKCLVVPEFQKRGAVHYHLLTNIPYDSELFLEEKYIWQPKEKKWQIGKPVKSWTNGISFAKKLDNIDVVAYLSKYMTKDIDNRLFSHHRYYCVGNLKRPIENFLDLDNPKHCNYYNKVIENIEIIYSNQYKDIYKDETITFCELTKCSQGVIYE